MRPLGAIAAVAVACALTIGCAPNRGAAYDKSLADARRAYHDGQYEAAADAFDAAARGAKLPRDAAYARYEAALARARAGDVARAGRELRALADAQPPNEYSASAAYKAADLALARDPGAGYAELEAFLRRFPESGMARVALARLLRHDDESGPAVALGRLDDLARRFAGRALEQDILYERAKRLAALGRDEEARDAFLDVAARFPYPTGAYFDDALFRASELEEKLGRPREAIAHLERLLSYRESSVTIGSYERPRYVPALLAIARLYEALGDRANAREALHRLYADFETSTMRDDALWREAALWEKDGQREVACHRLATLAKDFPDSRYVPCVTERCPAVKRPAKSKAPATCRAYITREAAGGADRAD